MSNRHSMVLRNGVLAACTLCALVLLASFYSIVSGAVDRVAQHRLASIDVTRLSSNAVSARPSAPRAQWLARSDN